jgi:hypothetical protein
MGGGMRRREGRMEEREQEGAGVAVGFDRWGGEGSRKAVKVTKAKATAVLGDA